MKKILKCTTAGLGLVMALAASGNVMADGNLFGKLNPFNYGKSWGNGNSWGNWGNWGNGNNGVQKADLKVTAVLQEYTGVVPTCPSKFGGTITATGDSELLGRVVLIATDCITPAAGAIYNFSNGKLIIMTTDGSQIFANYSGQFVPTGNGANYVFNSATFQITGGNGSYSKASGGGTLLGGEDMVTGTGNLELTGTISYKNRND